MSKNPPQRDAVLKQMLATAPQPKKTVHTKTVTKPKKADSKKPA
jgi:hypothetical protein